MKLPPLSSVLCALPLSLLAQGDPYETQGNTPPAIRPLSQEQEKAILADASVPEGFDLTLFAAPPAVNYPVYVAAAPNGDLYVSSDGNGSLGRKPGRGRVLRLRDTNGDGRADQVTEFVKSVDSPRGLVWDHDRLYLVHPPDVSAYIDRDGDGVAEEEKVLVRGIAFGFKDRPADHTTNGLSLGIDGWLYVAGGDFGFLDASGSDGRRLQHRGGGVIRLRPDGSGLELFATGTRNILGTPISPLLDLFARDNTNDGGGWDVRFHHFTGLEDHGYPRLYKNHPSEHVAPLADYGGGSGCGSAYLNEPGFPDAWNRAPLTCDWGTGGLWKHSVQPKGATFTETKPPEKLVSMTRPTDADVDGLSHVFQASWKGATFDWQGPDVGYIVRVSPRGYTPEPLPQFDSLTDADLVRLLESPSQIRSMEAQRTLLRRNLSPETQTALLQTAGNASKPLEARVAALYALSQRTLASSGNQQLLNALAPLAADPLLQRFLLRAAGDAALNRQVGTRGTAPADWFATGLKSSDARTRLEALVGAARQGLDSLAPQMTALLADTDPVVAHTAVRALALLKADAACFAVLDGKDAAKEQGALQTLMRIHEDRVVTGLIERISSLPEGNTRLGLIGALCRLHFTEAEWKGDSWGTRPDTRGPYYEPAPWPQTPRIAETLKTLLAKASASEAGQMVALMNRNRIQSNDALTRILALAEKDATLATEAVAQLAQAETIPENGIPVLIRAATDADAKPATLAQAIAGIAKTDRAEAWKATLIALPLLQKAKGFNKDQDAGREAFLNSPKLENVHQLMEAEAEKVGSEEALWAEAALLALSKRQTGSPEAREMSRKALDSGWENPKRRIQILHAAGRAKLHAIDQKIVASLGDPDKAVAAAARQAAGALRLKTAKDTTPKIGSLSPEEALKSVLSAKGDASTGEQVFARANCTLCHTTSQDQVQKGPYLGNIAQTYQRPDLAANILDPNRTIAQGFATQLVTLKDGSTQMGFITDESGDRITLRNAAAQEFTWTKDQIASRESLPNSVMPPGLMAGFSVHEFASLLDYLEGLAKKK